MRLVWRLLALWRWLHPPPEGIYRQQLARFDAAVSEVKPLALPPIRPMKESVRVVEEHEDNILTFAGRG